MCVYHWQACGGQTTCGVGVWDWTRVVRLGSKRAYLLSHLSSSVSNTWRDTDKQVDEEVHRAKSERGLGPGRGLCGSGVGVQHFPYPWARSCLPVNLHLVSCPHVLWTLPLSFCFVLSLVLVIVTAYWFCCCCCSCCCVGDNVSLSWEFNMYPGLAFNP